MSDEEKQYSKREVNEILKSELVSERKKNKKWLIIITIVLAVIFFFIGFFTYYAIVGKDIIALKWALDKVEDEAYLDLSREEIIKAAGTGATTSLIDQYSGFLTPKDLEAFFKDFNGSAENFGLAIIEGELRKDIPCFGVFVAGVLEGTQAENLDVPIMSMIKSVEVGGKVYDTLAYNMEKINKLFDISAGEKIKITFMTGAFYDSSEKIEEKTIEFTKTANENDYLGLALIEGEVVKNTNITGKFVVQTSGGSPAERAGVKPFSKFYKIRIGGEEINVENMSIDEIFDDVIGDNRTVEFCFKEIVFENGQLVEKVAPYVEITKSEYSEKYLIYLDNEHQTGIVDTKALRSEPLTTLDEDTAYIQFDSFMGGLPDEFAAAMEVFKSGNKSKLILDLRGNGGGDLEVLRKIAGYLTSSSSSDDKQLVLTMKRRNKNDQAYYTDGTYYRQGYKVDHLVVLCDGGTASASEALIGALMDYRGHDYANPSSNILLVGDNTYGKDIVQTIFSMPLTGYGVKITTAKYYTPSGNELSAENTYKNEEGVIKGVMPDYFITNNAYNLPYTYEADNELNFAINYLKTI